MDPLACRSSLTFCCFQLLLYIVNKDLEKVHVLSNYCENLRLKEFFRLIQLKKQYFISCSYAFTNRLAVAILRMPNGLDFSLDVGVDTTPPNGLTSPSSFNGISTTKLRKELLQSQSQNGGASTIMHADSYLNIYKIPCGKC